MIDPGVMPGGPTPPGSDPVVGSAAHVLVGGRGKVVDGRTRPAMMNESARRTHT
jgi:hypothetical protein